MKKTMRTLVIAVAGIGLGVALAATKASAADVVDVRNAIMKEFSGHNKAIKAFLKGNKDPKKAKALGNAGDIEFRASGMVAVAKSLPKYFPKGTAVGETKAKTRAKAEIWSDWAGFQAAANKMAAEAAKLEAAAATGDKAKIEAVMKNFGKAACGSCHRKYRAPEKKKSS